MFPLTGMTVTALKKSCERIEPAHKLKIPKPGQKKILEKSSAIINY